MRQMILRSLLFVAGIGPAICTGVQAQSAYQNPKAPVDQRVSDLLHQLTLKEKISLLGFISPGVTRLMIPAYVWWNEGLHGVARAGEATVFPQAIGAAASFDDQLLKLEADAISTEARAKYNLSVAQGHRLQYLGLTFWAPNINIFRDPRWGRGQETYGEDPYLTGRMGSAYVRGIQGDNPLQLKAAACAKHFAVHSGPEATRHSINVQVGEEDLRETYLPAFHTLVDSGVETVMCAYNRVNDQPCCTGKTLLKDILRNEWNFQGHVVTDCGALDDIWERHKALPDRVTVAAEAIKAGVNLDCSDLLQNDALQAIDKGMITETDIDKALTPNLRTAFKLGLYDEPSASPYKAYGADSVNNDYHQALALKMAEEGMVLLKNDGVLPLRKDTLKTMLVTGSNAANVDALLGNYHGVSSTMVTFTDGIVKAAGPAIGIEYDLGCDPKDTTHFGGIWISQGSDVTIAVIGQTPSVEGEEGDAFLSEAGGDRMSLSLAAGQIAFLKALRKATTHPIIAVVTGGSAMDINAIAPYADAIVLAWYPGAQGGTALANILFGKSPSGHLPLTFYKRISDLPPYKDYNMKGRTYRYFDGAVEYPFGFGLSYAQFSYQWALQPVATYSPKDTIHFGASIGVVSNKGVGAPVAVPQVYISYPLVKGKNMPLKELKGFQRVSVTDQRTVSFSIPLSSLAKWDPMLHKFRVYPGTYRMVIGENSRDEKLICTFKVQ